MRLELARRAIADLEDIEDYGTAAFGAERAESYVEELMQAMALLLEFPDFGATASSGPPGTRRRPVGAHVLFYRHDGAVLQIIRILHQRMDPARHLP